MSFATLDGSKLSFDNGASLNAARHLPRLWIGAFNAGDVEGLLELYEPEAALFVPGAAEPIIGLGALRRLFADLGKAQPQARLHDEPETRQLSERSAFIEGYFEFARGEGAWAQAHFRFLLVRHIRSWRISEHHTTILPVAVA